MIIYSYSFVNGSCEKAYYKIFWYVQLLQYNIVYEN